jgi:two-component system chemotaxis sensor kinase CheA
MAFSKADFVKGYVSEVREYIGNINSQIVSLKKNPKDKSIIEEILRLFHTIKGSSRMLDFSNVEKLTHSIEDVFKGLYDEKYEFTTNINKLVFKITEFLESCLNVIEKTLADDVDPSPYIETCRRASQGYFFDPDVLGKSGESETKFDGAKKTLFGEQEGGDDSFEKITSVKVDIKKINEIIQSYDNLIVRQFRLKHQIELFEKRLAEEKKSGQKKELPRVLKEELVGVEETVFETQRQIFQLRMLPLDIVLSPLKIEIEKESIRLGKEIDVDIPETAFMVDKVILEQLRIILIHLVRNCIDHGIEPAEKRMTLGKNPKGTISVHATQFFNRIIISVKDDGQGIDYERVRTKAIQLFQNRRVELETLSERDLRQFIFMAGFSTNSSSNEVSGRGMGLDIVRTCMEKIKGKIQLNSKKDEGTTFELTIPLSLATQRGLLVITGNEKVMIPSHYIQEVVTSSEENIISMQNKLYINIRNSLLPLYQLSSILETERVEKNFSVVVLEYLENRIAIVVDAIQQNENVIVNQLPGILQKMNSLQGVVYDENYSIVPILTVPWIIQRMKDLVVYDVKKFQLKNKKVARRILVVDDSLTTRQIEQAIFEADGYLVETAADGVEALEKLEKNKIDVVVTDINMPRMDGRTLLSNMRHSEQYAKIPVVVLSGAYDEFEKSKFMEAGAQSFIIKSDFERGNLLDIVKEICR